MKRSLRPMAGRSTSRPWATFPTLLPRAIRRRPGNPATQTPRKPEWIRVRAPTSPEYQQTRDLMRRLKLNTVCEEAACPNIGECWKQKHATVMILGSVCTRACAFCNVATGKPDLLDPHEPEHVAEAVGELGLSHVVVTSVDRDDLDDGGAEHFARVIRAVRERAPGTTIEVLTPDFLKKPGAIETVVAARPDVYNHNLETVPRLYRPVRPGARYFHSLRLLSRVKEIDPAMFTKSGIMVGLWRDPRRGAASHGRSALGRCGFPDHRPVSATDAPPPSGGPASCRRPSSRSSASMPWARASSRYRHRP